MSSDRHSGPFDPLSQRRLRVRPRKTNSRSVSSQRWLERQLNDPYVAAAQSRGFRSRAAFKLIELDERFHLLRPGLRIVDLGSAPGGWCQVAAEKIGKQGRIVAIDLLEMEPLPAVDFIQMDFLEERAEAEIIKRLGGTADLVLTDMAANATGHRQTDHLKIMALCEAAIDFAERILAPGGAFVGKVLRGGTENALLARMKRNYAEVRHAKPPASRADSAEMYIVAKGFR